MSRLVDARNAVGLSFFLNGATFATWVSRLPEIRHRLDPDGMFLNDHLRPLFGAAEDA